MQIPEFEHLRNGVPFSVLQTLFRARKKKPINGGATGEQLMQALSLNFLELEQAIFELRKANFVETDETQYLITTDGVDFVIPDWSPPSSEKPNDEPPGPRRGEPDSPSRVPKKRNPSGNTGAIALPLPKQVSND